MINSRRLSSNVDHTCQVLRRTQVLSIADRRPSLVDFALADGRRAGAKFSKSRVGDKVPDRYTLIFIDTLTSSKHSVAKDEINVYAKNILFRAVFSIRYRRVTDRQINTDL